MRSWLFTMIAALLITGSALAQNPPAPTPVSPPALSVEEDLRKQILTLQTELEIAISQRDACVGDRGTWRAKFMSAQLTADESALKAFVDKNHPGFSWNPKEPDPGKAFTKLPDPPTPAAAGTP